MFFRWTVVLSLCSLLVHPRARAVVIFGTGDPAANTTPPVGALANSGWVSQTDQGPSANAISPHHLLTAAHIGIRVGHEVHFDGLVYTVQRTSIAPESDLQILEVAGRMDSNRLATLYTGTDEAGRAAVVHGHGRSRGAPVYREGPGGRELRGWNWGSTDSRLRWGTNVINATATYPGNGSYLLATFSGTAGRDEAAVSLGDSGGGIFVRAADGRWKLAGLMYDVEGYFRQTATSAPFFAALFDRRGFYSQDPFGNWVKLPESGIEPGTLWQATRVSFHQSWIARQVAVPPVTTWPRLLSSSSPDGSFVEHPAYAVNPADQKITFKANERQRFFKLGSLGEIQSIDRTGILLEIHYH